MADFILILLSAALVNNIIVSAVVGSDPTLAFLRQIEVARGLCLTMLLLLPLSTFIACLVEVQLVVPYQLEHLRLLVSVSIILLVIWMLKSLSTVLDFQWLGKIDIYLPFAGINTLVLGSLLLNEHLGNGLLHALAFAIGTVIGFSILLYILVAMNERLQAGNVPEPFRGLPVVLLSMAILSMAFMGLAGLFIR